MSYGKICFMGGYVLEEDISYRRKCLIRGHMTGGYILLKNISYGRTCLMGEHIIQEDICEAFCISA